MTVSGDDRDVLLNQLADEFAVRRRAGERPRLEEYCDRYPDLADDIRSLFPAMLELERARADAGPELAVLTEARRTTSLGDFRLLREVGRGGMGVVYEAEQISLGRRVALKLLPATVFRDPVKRRRFEREARAAAKLHHTNIVPVHGFGEHDGTPYYVMQFIPGLGLDAVIDELGVASGRTADPNQPPDRSGLSAALARSLLDGTSGTGEPKAGDDLGATAADGTAPGPDRGSSSASMSTSGVHLPGQTAAGPPSTSGKRTTYWESVARIGVQVGGALAYAHKLGVLHRDIKPGNLLLDLDGIVWVTDFGLAKADDSDNLTHTGDVLGTLRYMPPEAFEGKSDARSDVYALGLTLFELVALRPAYEERDRNKLIKQVTTGDPPRLRKLRTDAPGDLVTIVEKATDRDPARRYQTAGALVDDLQRFLNDEPIRARQQTTMESVWRWARQNRSVAALAVVVFVLLMAITAGSVIAAAYFHDLEVEQRGLARAKVALAERNERLAEENEAAKKTAEEAKRRAEITIVDMQTARGLLAGERGDPARAVLWFAKAAEAGELDPTRLADNRLRAGIWARSLTVPVRAFPVSGGVRALEFCPGKDLLLVLATDRLSVRDWPADSYLRWAADVPNVGAAAWSPDGDWLAIGYHSGDVQVRGVPDGRVLQEVKVPGSVTALAISPDGKRLAVAASAAKGSPNSPVVLPWDVSGPGPPNVGETAVRVLDVPARALLPGEWPHPQPVYALAFDRAGDRLVTAGLDKRARVFAVGDAGRPAPLFAPVPHAPRHPSPPALIDNDRRLVTVSAYGTARPSELTVWDATTGKPAGPGVVRARPTYPPRVVAGPRGDWFATAGHYGPEIWPTDAAAKSVYLDDHTGYVEDLVAGPDGKTLLSASWDQTARLWSAPDGKQLGSPLPHMGLVTRCAIAGDNVHIATLAEGLIRVWRRSEGATADVLTRLGGGVARPSFDGRLIAAGIWHEQSIAFMPIGDGTLVVRDATSGAAAGPAVALRGQVVDSCVCADNKTVAAVSEETGTGWFTLADIASGRLVAEPMRLPGSPRSVAARPTASQVAVLCAGGELLVFDAGTGARVWTEKPDGASADGRSSRVEYTADGATLVALTNEGGGTVQVQDAATGRFRGWSIRPAPKGGSCRTLALSPDGKLLATAINGKNAAQVWDLATGQPLCEPLPHPGDHYGLFCLCFSRDGRYILTGSKDGQARLWDWRAGTLACPALKQDDEVFAVALTDDGRFALTGGRDRASKLHVWELKTGRLVAPKVPLPNNVVSFSLSPDGSRVVSGSMNGVTRIDLGKLLAPPEMPIEDLQMLAELASGQRIDQGDESGLTQEEWLDRLARFNRKYPGTNGLR
jgi:serine/threonine protein kinase/WD40 repeat protein